MTSLVTAASILATAALAPFFLLLLAVVVAALAGRPALRRPPARPERRRARFLIVIPAHDEEGVISATVRSCRELDYDPDLFSIYVIADNCADQTARLAREAGAEVVERTTPDLRSKGHALEYFFTQVAAGRADAGHDATVLIDADTVVDPGLLTAFDEALGRGEAWIQGYYTVRNPDASWRTRMMTYAFSLANGVWMAGLDRLGLSVGLKGNGMCFSSRALGRVPWAAHGLVEDMEFALILRVKGERVRFEPSARVYGEMVSRGGPGAASQRRRWEEGRRSLRGRFARQLVRSSSLSMPIKACYLVDLFFPPLVTLTIALLAVSGIDVLSLVDPPHAAIASSLLPIHDAMWATLVAYALAPVMVMKLPPRYLGSLINLPTYAIWKVSLAFGRRSRGWVRTPREMNDVKDSTR